eukprot:TRINITY_DN15605_c0_g1_i1.p1 TRINITY_DN15605_c0_g1~~TRINITY_DN15605_c0_g1_i1.p1  ORF type:complete len:386 (-),score=53.15 TRINITY_DN15605_c0_g1_i1:90-1226(-)
MFLKGFCILLPLVFTILLHVHTTTAVYRGMNIGGWLVLEYWIRPSLFNDNGVTSNVGEWGFCEQLGSNKASQVLNSHWDSWVSYSDLQQLASNGITHLRIPVGYWIVDIQPGEPFVTGGMYYLKRLMGWAQQLNLGVIVDLHGAPGSQNGHDNSGRVGPINWPQQQNIDRSVFVIGNITQQLIGFTSLKGIEVLNEPWTIVMSGGTITFDTLKTYYLRAYNAVRGVGFTGDIWIPDGWDNNQWNGFMAPPNYYSVYIDVHLYHCFGGPRDQNDAYANIQYTCSQDQPMLQSLTSRDWSVVGEFSNCVSNPASDFNSWVTAFDKAQWSAYGAAGPNPGSGPAKGAFFWNFKIEGGNALWNYQAGLNAGTMPSNFDFSGC